MNETEMLDTEKKKRAGRRSKVKEGEVREAIINVATQVFADNGYDGTSMNEIAQKAGVTKPLIFYYFKSKQDLFLEILSQVQDSSIANFEHMIYTGAHSLEELLDMIVDVSYSFLNSDDYKMRFFSNLVSSKPNKVFFAQKMNHWKKVYQLLLKACNRAYETHEIDADPEIVAPAIYAVLHYSYFKMSHLNERILGELAEELPNQQDEVAQSKAILKLVLRGACHSEQLVNRG